MRFHFFFGYDGNKREEVEKIYDVLKDSLEGVTTIVEPFCGSSAFSFYLSTLFPKRFKYVLNDNSHHLMTIYKLCREDPTGFEKWCDEMEEHGKDHSRENYNKLIQRDDITGFTILQCWSIFALGYYKMDTERNGKKSTFRKLRFTPIIDFLRNENVELIEGNAITCLEAYKNNPLAVIFLDPPYILRANKFYSSSSLNFYDWISPQDLRDWMAKVILCLNDIPEIRSCFKTLYFGVPYPKRKRSSSTRCNQVIIRNLL